ncbi:hypothetical protein [Bradyrhizobium iriomotense]|uniref:hypothetical protein n=1 Tax=Bradyrhizobium iriomotense TaxID=441950 RepID=UPI0024E121B9|nr:hypothetical protein [Bradyrhizobium iriomotense]
MNSYVFAAASGLFLGIAIVWWVRPDTNAGAAFIVVVATTFCLVSGVVLSFLGKVFAKARGRSAGEKNDIM